MIKIEQEYVCDLIDEKSANGRVLELTPVAIKAGQLLADRLYGKKDVKMEFIFFCNPNCLCMEEKTTVDLEIRPDAKENVSIALVYLFFFPPFFSVVIYC